MNALLRHPHRYLVAHWTLTGALAAALVLPNLQSSGFRAPRSTGLLTLITGQQVRFTDDAMPQPHTNMTEGPLFGPDQYALPTTVDPHTILTMSGSDPAAASAQPVFDAELFDVSYQVINGFGDAASPDIPVLVQFANRDLAERALADGMVDGGIHLTHLFEYVPVVMGYVSKQGPFVPPTIAAQSGITAIFLDGVVRDVPDGLVASTASSGLQPLLNDSLPLIGADVARKRGLTGQGIKVAVVDTGIDATHPDLKGRIVAARDFSGDNDPQDGMGHGTHVAGIVGGTGAASDGKFGGVAPAVQFINAKALSKNGSGSMGGIMKAMEWAADQGARIENLSLGGGATDGTDPLSQDVNAISAKKNVLFVIAAGNSGPRGKVSTPAAANAALAVAAIDKERALAPFSSQGPRVGDLAVKPEIAAPGVRITAPRANYGENDPYVTYSGTSMATPMVAGAAALVMQLHPDWSAVRVKDALMNGASPIGDSSANYVSVYAQGTGVVDLRTMLDQQVLMQPANLSFGVLKRNQASTKSFVLENLTTQPLTIELAVTTQKGQGATQPQLELSATAISIPAGGTTTVDLSVRGAATGTFGGLLTASQGETVLARAAVGYTIR